MQAGWRQTPAVTNVTLAKLERRALLQLVLLSQTGTTHIILGIGNELEGLRRHPLA